MSDHQPYKKQEQVNFGDHVEVAKMALHNKVETCLHIHLLASFCQTGHSKLDISRRSVTIHWTTNHWTVVCSYCKLLPAMFI